MGGETLMTQVRLSVAMLGSWFDDLVEMVLDAIAETMERYPLAVLLATFIGAVVAGVVVIGVRL